MPLQISSAGSIPSQSWLLPPGDCWYHDNLGKWLSPNLDNTHEDNVDHEYNFFDDEMIQAEAKSIASKVKQLARLPLEIYDQKTREAAKELGMTLRTLQRAVKAEKNLYRIAEAESNSFFNSDSDNQKYLEVRKDNLPATAHDVAKILANDPKVFLRGKPTRMIYNNQKGRHEPQLMTSEDVVMVVHNHAKPYQWHILSDGLRDQRYITLPRRVGQFYLNSKDYKLRLLNGIASAPLLSDDGDIRMVEGYDPLTMHWCENIPSISAPDTPTSEQAKDALLLIRKAVRTFPFADAEKVFDKELSVDVVDISKPPGRDESAMIASLFTAVCRPSLQVAPGLKISSPSYSGEGIGQSLLARAICAIATGIYPSAISSCATTEEFDKRITTGLINADQVLFFNKLDGMTLRSNLIANVITERTISVRRSRQSEILQLNSTAFVVATGTDLTLSADLLRMFMTVQLDAGIQDPEGRPFKGDFLAETLARREELLTAVLTIWRWGRQNQKQLKTGKPLGSFEQWGQWCRDPLLNLGCVDPVEISLALKADDPERRFAAGLFSQWWEKHQDTPISGADLDITLKRMIDPQGRSRQYLAGQVRRLENTHIGGFVLTRSNSGRWGADLYQLRKINSENLQDNQEQT